MAEEGATGAVPSGIAGWTRKGGAAVLDQGLFAGSNFLLSLALARWLSPDEYGAYALAWSVFLLLAAFHTALVTEPMLVFGAGRYASFFRGYLGVLISGSTMATIAPVPFLVAAGWVLGEMGEEFLAWTFYALALMTPCVLLLWLVRRAFYALMKPLWAALGGLIYLAAILGGVAALASAELLSPATALGAMAVASLAASAVLTLVLRPTFKDAEPDPGIVAAQHWRYGRWSSATTVLTWIPGNMYYLLLPTVTGLGGSGALKAVLNLLMPVFHAMSAVAVLLVPTFVRVLHQGSLRALRARVARTMGLFVAGALVYGLVLAFLGRAVFQLLYTGRYAGEADLLFYAAPFPAAAAVTSVLGGALRALERPDLVFRCYALSGGVAVVVGLPLLLNYGVAGSLFGTFASSGSTAIIMAFFWRRARVPLGQTA